MPTMLDGAAHTVSRLRRGMPSAAGSGAAARSPRSARVLGPAQSTRREMTVRLCSFACRLCCAPSAGLNVCSCWRYVHRDPTAMLIWRRGARLVDCSPVCTVQRVVTGSVLCFFMFKAWASLTNRVPANSSANSEFGGYSVTLTRLFCPPHLLFFYTR
jgi:hypothetical protein